MWNRIVPRDERKKKIFSRIVKMDGALNFLKEFNKFTRKIVVIVS
jgi:hypothetical protein